MLCVFFSRSGEIIANYFFKTTNKWLLFTSLILCGVSVLAEQAASVCWLIYLGFVHVALKITVRQFHTIFWVSEQQFHVCTIATGAMDKNWHCSSTEFAPGQLLGQALAFYSSETQSFFQLHLHAPMNYKLRKSLPQEFILPNNGRHTDITSLRIVGRWQDQGLTKVQM